MTSCQRMCSRYEGKSRVFKELPAQIKRRHQVLRRGVLARVPENTPDASRTDPPEGLAIPAVPYPRTLCYVRATGSEDPLTRAQLQIDRSFATVANPDPKALRRSASPGPKTLRCGVRIRARRPFAAHNSRSGDLSVRLRIRTRRPFAAATPPGSKTLCCDRRSGPEGPFLRTRLRVRRPFAACAFPDPKTLPCTIRTFELKCVRRNKKFD